MIGRAAAWLAAAAALATLSACHTGGSGTGPFPTPAPTGTRLYVSDSSNNAIFEFRSTANNVDLPLVTISGAATQLIQPYPIAVDQNGNVWVGNHGSPPDVLEFAANAVGAAPPNAIMTVSSAVTPGALAVTGLTFDSTGKLYVATGTNNRLLVYTSPGNGTPTASQEISGLNTRLSDAEGIALDGAGNIYTASATANAVLEFAANASGNVAPIRIIQGILNSHLNVPTYVAVDSSGNIFVMNSGDGFVREYAAGASGDAAPIATLTTPGMGGQLVFDTLGNLYVGALNRNPGGVSVFQPPITNANSPVRLLQSPVFAVPDGVYVH